LFQIRRTLNNMFWNKFPGQKYHTWFIQCGNQWWILYIFNFQSGHFTGMITGLTLHWKYHAPDESKLLYRGCLASFENRKFCIKLSKLCIKLSKFCIKLSKIQSRKNTDISVLSVLFSGIGFRFFFQIPQQPTASWQISSPAVQQYIY
jgi:hypothetical protein